MAYYRKRYGSMSRRRPSYPRRPRTSNSIKSLVQRYQARYSETKFITNKLQQVKIVAGTGGTFGAVEIAQGVGQSGRVGNQIKLKSMYHRWCFNFAPTTGTADSCVVRLLYYIPSNTPTDIIPVSTAPMSLLDLDKVNIIHDQMITLGGNGPQSKMVTIKKNWFRGARRGINIQYSDATALSATRNDIQVLFLTNQSDVFVDMQGRTYYKDP